MLNANDPFRLDRSAFSVGRQEDQIREYREGCLRLTLQQRVKGIQKLREHAHGRNLAAARLQRVLAVSQRGEC
jgi:hypothetical protein